MKEVVLIFRKPFFGQISIEYIFYTLSDLFQNKKIAITNVELPRYSTGLVNRCINVLSMAGHKRKIVHVTGDVHYALLGAIFSKRVLTIHDFNFMLNKGFFGRAIYWWLWIYLPVKFSHRVTVISESTKAGLLKYMPVKEGKISIIGDFIDDIYQPVLKSDVAKVPRLLQIGTTFNKNLQRLIEALKGMDCTLVIIGKLNKEVQLLLQQQAIPYENKFNISTEELYKEYSQADLLCYVSTSEGFGMPILEAQATGLPVLTANCSSMPEVAGNGALLINPFSVEEIKKGITTILSDKALQKKLIENGFANSKRFSKEVIAAQYLALYKTL